MLLLYTYVARLSLCHPPLSMLLFILFRRLLLTMCILRYPFAFLPAFVLSHSRLCGHFASSRIDWLDTTPFSPIVSPAGLDVNA
ncbi:hypothetical protein BD626DRAFT_259250 [Schizophyllum amplum]|uniref:Uncharacterized protein n=1 Tax=Schizophyllum amplum TaxID=97359 RepID=A0A550BUF4_9AGAR|nr:hypothetical protein BD626DRAFT_259250 [Auriculariopsis ampla]